MRASDRFEAAARTASCRGMRITVTALASLMAVSMLEAPAAWAAPAGASSTCSRVDMAPVVKVALGKSTIVRPAAPIQRIVLGTAAKGNAPAADGADNSRPGVADVDVMLLSPNEVYLLGKSLGSTNVILMDRQGGCMAFDVLVSMDALGLLALLQELLPGEKGIKVSTAQDSIVLSGEVSDSEALARATELAQAFTGQGGSGASASGGSGQSGTPTSGGTRSRVINMLGVAAPQQVMLEVKVAEVSKSLLDQFGIDFSRIFVSGDGGKITALSGLLGGAPLGIGRLTGAGGSGVPLSSVGTVVGSNVSNAAGLVAGNVTSTPVFDSAGNFLYNNYTTSYGTVPGKTATSATLNMQKTDGLVKVLAEPSIMAISGQTGSFLAGGKVFIPVSQTNGSGGRDITLEEKEFGVSVRFTPTVLGGGRINLHVRPEVSELNASGVTIAGLNGNAVLPSFTSRRAETTVQLADGQSFAIGGLVKNNTTTNIRAFPFLGELPVLGALFRSSDFQTDRTELVFVVTPRLVKPLPADYKLPTDHYVPPTRSDIILKGRTEGERSESDDAPPPGSAPATRGGFDMTTPTAPATSAPSAAPMTPKEKP